MAWLNDPPLSIQTAQSRGQDVYEVLVTQWGVISTGDLQWPPAGQPPIPASIAGIAIGPRSLVDRCWVSYSLQQPLSAPLDPSRVGSVTNRLRHLSVDAPLIFSQASAPGNNKPGTLNDPLITQVQKGSLYVFAMADAPSPITFPYPLTQHTTVLPPSFLDVKGVSHPMNSGNAGAMFPGLHLLIYLKAPVAYVPTKRSPLQVSGAGITTAGGAEQLIAQIPTFGRKSVHLMLVSPTTANYRVGALRGVSQLANMQEQPVDQTSVPTAPNTPVIITSCAGLNFQADYVNIYANTDAPGSVGFQLTAYD